MKITEGTSWKIRNMSIICAMLVVTIHIDWPHDTFSFTWLIHEVISTSIARIAVPFFFVVSGYFLSLHMNDDGWYIVEGKKRVFSLIIPFVVWTLIATILVTPLPIMSDIMAQRPFGCTPRFSDGRWIATFGLDPRQGPNCNGALWYVRCLFSFVILAPVFKWLVSKGRLIWLSCAFALTLAHSSWAPFPQYLQKCFSLGFSLSGVFYFSVGIFIGMSKGFNLPKSCFVLCSCIGFVFLLAKLTFAYFSVNPNVSLVTVAIPFIMYSLWCVMPESKWPSELTACSFPIFLMHMPLVTYFTLLVKYSSLHDSQCASIVIFLGAVLVSVGIAFILRKFYPRVNNFLFAGRS